MLPRFFIACLPRSKCLDFMAAVPIWVDFGGQENKVSNCFHCLPFICHEVMRLDAMILVSWMLSFKPAFSLSSFTFIQRLSAIRVVLSAYLRLLIFLPTILIPACVSSSLAFHMMYSACKLNKQYDNIQLWGTPFPICNQSAVPYPVLTVASWPAYRFLRRQVGWSWYSQLLKNFPQFVLIHTVKGFGVVNKGVIDIFMELLLSLWSSGCWQFDLWFLWLF